MCRGTLLYRTCDARSLFKNNNKQKKPASTLWLKSEQIQPRRFVQGPFLQCRCPDRVKLGDVDVGVGEGARTGKQQEWTWRTFSPRDGRRRGLRPSLAAGPAAVLGQTLSELLVCCGHPQQHRPDTPAPTSLPPCLLCVRAAACVLVFSPGFFGIATASSLGVAPLSAWTSLPLRSFPPSCSRRASLTLLTHHVEE